MKYSDFEKQIGKKLAKAEEPVNMDLLLGNLGIVEYPKKKNAKPFPFWIMIPILVFGSILTFMAMNGSQISAGENPSASYASNSDINSQSSIEKKSVPEIDKKAQSPNEKTIRQPVNIKTEPGTLLNQEKPESHIGTDGSVKEKTNGSPFNINLEKRSNINTEKVNYQNLDDEVTKKKSNVIVESRLVENQGNILNTNTNTNTKTQILGLGKTKSKYQAYSKNTSKQQEKIAIRSTIALPLSLSNRTINFEKLEEYDNGLFSRMKINCPSFNQAHWRLALIPEVGVFAPIKTLENKLTEDTPDFVARQTQESTLEGLNIGLYTMLVRDKLPVYVKAGVSYSRITERMNLEYNYTELDTSVGVISETVSANGDTITQIYGDIITEIRKTGKNRQHSYIHLFDVPISIGYNTYIGGFDIGIEAGVKVNLMTRATGSLLISESEFTNLSLDRKFKPRIGLSYFGGLLIGRNFGRFGDFYLAPRFTYYPDDFSNELNSIRQQYLSIGVNVGVVYKLK